MKIAISADGRGLADRPCPTFGRTPYFVICDTETGAVEALENPAAEADHGAGTQAARAVVASGAKAVCTGRMGPNAWDVCEAAGVEVFATAGDTVEAVVSGQKAGRLARLEPSAARGAGHGGGRGRGGGRGGGRRGR